MVMINRKTALWSSIMVGYRSRIKLIFDLLSVTIQSYLLIKNSYGPILLGCFYLSHISLVLPGGALRRFVPYLLSLLLLQISTVSGAELDTVIVGIAVFLILVPRVLRWSNSSVYKKFYARVLSDPRKILLIGGFGYIGTELAKQLKSKGYFVTVADINLLKNTESLSPLSRLGVKVIQFDGFDADILTDLLCEHQLIVHLGGVVGDPACAVDEKLTSALNVNFTRLLLKCMPRDAGHRLVFLSSCSVYGISKEMVSEASAPNPISLYAETKLISETDIFSISERKRLHVTILRLATVYGLNPIRMRYDLVANLFAAKAAFGERIDVFNGSSMRPFVHVQDVAGAIYAVLSAPRALVAGQIFNCGSTDENYSIDDLAKFARDLNPDITVSIDEDELRGDRRSYAVDFRKISEKLGWRPSRHVPDGMREIFSYLKEVGADRDILGSLPYNNTKATIEFMEEVRTGRVNVDF